MLPGCPPPRTRCATIATNAAASGIARLPDGRLPPGSPPGLKETTYNPEVCSSDIPGVYEINEEPNGLETSPRQHWLVRPGVSFWLRHRLAP